LSLLAEESCIQQESRPHFMAHTSFLSGFAVDGSAAIASLPAIHQKMGIVCPGNPGHWWIMGENEEKK
jgi:hypothetical protein